MTSEINFHKAVFTQSAPSIRECPPEEGVEVAFAGRSNAGKSSAINALTNNGKLARTSKTPGRTQLLNFFALSEEQRLVDLPGYGYAKAGKTVKKKWAPLIDAYLEERSLLRLVLLLIDSRREFNEEDQAMIDWTLSRQIPLLVIFTKSEDGNIIAYSYSEIGRSGDRRRCFKIRNIFLYIFCV